MKTRITLTTAACIALLAAPAAHAGKPKAKETPQTTTACAEMKTEIDSLNWSAQTILSQPPGQHSITAYTTISRMRDGLAAKFKLECHGTDEWNANPRFYELAALRGNATQAKL